MWKKKANPKQVIPRAPLAVGFCLLAVGFWLLASVGLLVFACWLLVFSCWHVLACWFFVRSFAVRSFGSLFVFIPFSSVRVRIGAGACANV